MTCFMSISGTLVATTARLFRELSTKKGLEWESAEEDVEFTLTGLEADTSYNIQVQAVNSAGAGQYSDILTASTAKERK